MNPHDLLVEAWRNVSTGTTRSLLSLAILGPLVLGLAWLDMEQVAAAQREAATYRDGGGATWVLASDGHVDGARCEALTGSPGVTTAGAMRSHPTPFIPRSTPRTSIPVYDITPGLAHQLDPAYTTGIALDTETATALGIRPGDVLLGRDGNAVVTHTYTHPNDGRDQVLAYALTRATTPTGTYDQCRLAQWPPDPATASVLLRATLTPGADPARVRVSQLNPRLGDTLDAPQHFTDRPTRHAPLAAFVLAAGITTAVTRLRRLELAAARHLGLSRTDVVALLITETTLIGIPATLTATTAVAAYAATTHLDGLAPFGLRVLALALLGTLTGALLTALATTEAKLYQYFKTR